MTGDASICPCCGRDVRGVDREISMRYPDAVAALPQAERDALYVEHARAFASAGQRAFVRALLPVRLSDGHEFHFGVWLEVPREQARLAADVWEEPAYADLVLSGTLANAVPPWGDALRDAPCIARVRHAGELPYVVESGDAVLARVLAQPWQRAECEELVARLWG